MKTHTIKLINSGFGFIIDDKIVATGDRSDTTFVILLNSGPKKEEEYVEYIIRDDINKFNYIRSFSNNIICNEHICIEIIGENYNEIYMKGFIINVLKSDLDIIQKMDLSSSYRIVKKENLTRGYTKRYLISVFGQKWFNLHYYEFKDLCGVQLFKKEIYLNLFDGTFAIDLSDIDLKDEFEQLIKENRNKIKNILIPNDIPLNPKYSIYSMY